jgi:zinc transport system substrate-binding protein
MTRLSAAIFFTLCLLSLTLLPPSSGAEPIPVFVSIVPQKYFVEKIGKGLVDVSVMVPPAYNPHIYEPKPNQMVALSKARIYFAIGITFEDAWLGKFAAINAKMRIVHTEAGVEKIPMLSHYPHEVLEDEGEQKAKDEHEDEHGTMDPHVWLSPPEAKIIAKNILRALQETDPTNSSTYEENTMRFLEEIERLDSELRSIFAGKKGMKFMVFHPSWGYFARAYGLEQVPIEIEGKEPKPAQLKNIIEYARKERIKVIFVQPQFSTKNAETIAKAIGGQVVFANPLSSDWGKNLRDQAEKFKAALR